MSFVTKMALWNTRCLHALASQVEKADERLTDPHGEGCAAASPHNHPCPTMARTQILGPPPQGTSAGHSHSPQETLAAAEPCPRMQKLFCRLHGQPELLTYCALSTSSCEIVPSAHPFTICFSSDEEKN